MIFNHLDLCAGIGGFSLGLKDHGFKTVAFIENDKNCISVLKDNFTKGMNETIFDNIHTYTGNCKEQVDIITAGFPCQPFSNAGKNLGVNDNRGKIIYEVIRIIKESNTKFFILENVRGILKYNLFVEDFTNILRQLGYKIQTKIYNPVQFGVPQNRNRVFFIGSKDHDFELPFFKPDPCVSLGEFLNKKELNNYTSAKTIRVGGRGSPITGRHCWDGYYKKDGTVYRLTVDDCRKLQGFPDNFIFKGSETQALKQLGNAVSINVVNYLGKIIYETMKKTSVKHGTAL